MFWILFFFLRTLAVNSVSDFPVTFTLENFPRHLLMINVQAKQLWQCKIFCHCFELLSVCVLPHILHIKWKKKMSTALPDRWTLITTSASKIHRTQWKKQTIATVKQSAYDRWRFISLTWTNQSVSVRVHLKSLDNWHPVDCVGFLWVKHIRKKWKRVC